MGKGQYGKRLAGFGGREKELWLPSVVDPTAAFLLCVNLW